MFRRTAFALVMLLSLTAGCIVDFADSGGATSDTVGGPGFHVRSSDFYWSYGAWGESFEDRYAWRNPSGAAHAEVRHALSAGRVDVRILDANESVVWSQALTPDTATPQQWHTGDGPAGGWTIVIDRVGARGQIDLHVWQSV